MNDYLDKKIIRVKDTEISILTLKTEPPWERYIWNNKSKVIYGPVLSRRLGWSLGINLFPFEGKVCTFNCVYCDCGNTSNKNPKFLSLEEIKVRILKEIKEILNQKLPTDFVTFAGNGEPTYYPFFPEVVEFIKNIKKKFLTDKPIAIFTNASLLTSQKIREALKECDEIIIKIDADNEHSFKKINQPVVKVNFEEIITSISQINKFSLSIALIDDRIYGNIDHIKKQEFINIIKKLYPKELHLYSIDYPSRIKLNQVPLSQMIENAKFLANRINIPIKILQAPYAQKFEKER